MGARKRLKAASPSSLFPTPCPHADAIKREALEFIYRHGHVQGLRIAAVVMDRVDQEAAEIVAAVLDEDRRFERAEPGWWKLRKQGIPAPAGETRHTQDKPTSPRAGDAGRSEP